MGTDTFLNRISDKKMVSVPIYCKTSPSDYLILTKPGITFMVLVTTAIGFYMGSGGSVNTSLLIHTIIGIALVVGGASAANMYYERDIDGKMQRTRNRPLPDGRIQPYQAQIFAIVLSVIGLGYLATFVNPLALLFAALSFVNYVFIYTPLKRKSSLCVPVGAISGALPPVIGWAATGNVMDIKTAVIFSILFLWQFPHFLALSWMYKEDFTKAGLPLLSVTDPSGVANASQAVLYTIAMILVSLISNAHLMLASLGAVFLASAIYYAITKTRASARYLFFASIVYLPLILGLLAFYG